MRLGRLVAAGLVAGAVAGFVGALLRPRTVQNYRPDADRPATDARGDLAAAATVVVPDSRPLGPGADTGAQHRAAGSQAYALATSATDDDTATGDATATHTGSAAIDGTVPARTLDVDALPGAAPVADAVVAAAPSHGANG